MDSPSQRGAILDLVLGNKPGLLTGVSVEEYFGNSDHNSITFKLVRSKDKLGPWGKALNWGNAEYSIIRQELRRINWEQLLLAFDIWGSFKGQLTRDDMFQ